MNKRKGEVDIPLILLIIWTILIWIHGLNLGSTYCTKFQDDLKNMKREAIERGFATYTVDINGNASFTWIVKPEK